MTTGDQAKRAEDGNEAEARPRELRLEHSRPAPERGWASEGSPLSGLQARLETCEDALALSRQELARTSAELFATQQRLRAIMDALPVGVAFSADPGCHAIEGNPALNALFGARPNDNLSASAPDPDATGRRVRYFAGGRELSDSELPLQRAVAEQAPVPTQELEIHSPDGRRWLAEVSAAPIRDELGQVTGGLAVVNDITERKQAQEALVLADRRKDEFLAVLAHELRNPLAPIRNAAEVLGLQDGLPEKTRAAVGIIARQSEHLERLVNDLLDLARITSGRIQLHTQAMRVQDALQDSLQATAPLMARSGIELETRIAAEPLVVQGDAMRLAQVFTNLLSNAAKYSPAGGRVRVSLERRGSDAVVEVRDQGIGIAAEDFPRLFDIFTRGRHGGRGLPGTDGLGIGLALAQRLVAQHGGVLTADSEGLGRGSRLVVRLPIGATSEHPSAAAADRPPAAGPRRSRRILVVDDNPEVAGAFKLLLEVLGQEVEAVHGAGQVLDRVRAFQPELVFLDITMPGTDGYQAAQAIRTAFPGPRPRLVALTGCAHPRDGEAAQAAGFDRFLLKPAGLTTIEHLLAELDAMSPH